MVKCCFYCQVKVYLGIPKMIPYPHGSCVTVFNSSLSDSGELIGALGKNMEMFITA
jgi:hypothetical protein